MFLDAATSLAAVILLPQCRRTIHPSALYRSVIKEVFTGGVVGEYPAALDGQTTTSRPITVVAQVMAIVKARREGWPLGQRRKPPLAAALYAPHFAVPSLFPPVEPGSILRANRRSVVLNDPPLANHPDPIYCASALHGGIYAFETPDNLSGIPGEASHIQSIPYTRRWRGYFDSGRTIQAKKKN